MNRNDFLVKRLHGEKCNGFMRTSNETYATISQQQHFMEHGEYLTRWLMNCTHDRGALLGQTQKNSNQLLCTVCV